MTNLKRIPLRFAHHALIVDLVIARDVMAALEEAMDFPERFIATEPDVLLLTREFGATDGLSMHVDIANLPLSRTSGPVRRQWPCRS